MILPKARLALPSLSGLLSNGARAATLSVAASRHRSALQFQNASFCKVSKCNNGDSFQKTEFVSFGAREVPREEKASLVNAVFTSVADKYDLMNDLMSFGIHRLWKDHFAALVNFPPLSAKPESALPFSVLDLAGGTGDVAFRLFERALSQLRHSPSIGKGMVASEEGSTAVECCGVDITICDLNLEMIEKGQSRARERGIPVRPIVEGLQHCDNQPPLLAKPADFGRVGEVGLRWVRGDGERLPFASQSFDVVTIAFGLRNFTSPSQGVREAFRVLKPGGRFMCLEFSKVDNPALAPLYDFYSFAVLPTLGACVAGDRESYQYLAESIRRFPPQEELAKILQREGFSHVSFANMTMGVVAIHSGFKA